MHEGDRLAVDVCADQLRRRVPGGTGTYVRGLLSGLRASPLLDLSVTVSRAGGRDDEILDLGITTHTWPLAQPFSQPFVDHGIFRGARGADIIHTGSLGGPRPRPGQRSTVAIHDLLWRSDVASLSRRGYRWHEASYRRARRECSGVVTGAQRVADELLADGWHADQVLVSPHGADHVSLPDHEAARALLERHGVTGSFLVTAATLEPRKNLRRVVVAHRQLAEHGVEIPLVVVGPTGWGSDGLDGAGPDVVLLGEVPGPVLSALFADAELVLALSLAEGYGLPVLEAMSLGAVVLASSTTPAALELGCSVVDPTDVDAIAEGLNLLLHDSMLRAQYRDAAREVTANRTWANAAVHHETFWRRLV